MQEEKASHHFALRALSIPFLRDQIQTKLKQI
jgi:hypothetical protein